MGHACRTVSFRLEWASIVRVLKERRKQEKEQRKERGNHAYPVLFANLPCLPLAWDPPPSPWQSAAAFCSYVFSRLLSCSRSPGPVHSSSLSLRTVSCPLEPSPPSHTHSFLPQLSQTPRLPLGNSKQKVFVEPWVTVVPVSTVVLCSAKTL